MAADPAVVLLSGGLDSATTLAIAKQQGYSAYALSFEYGQRHRIEIGAARAVARQLGAAEHRIVVIDLRGFGGSALTDDIALPRTHGERLEIEPGNAIPITYVPARNTIFLGYALAWAEVLGARDIFIGVNAVDYSGYPDCRPQFIAQFQRLANLATKAGVCGASFHIHAPLIELTKAQIIRRGAELGVDFSLTHSCYDPAENGAACGECDACLLRAKGFAEAGIPDPAGF
ncbi:MAG: 7-cyano-7-deazaguanine synthase QueC [Verrucomicrobia bacterium]|nr:7-cyano-7-deazaguanine synthase QueC [Verrucomicrobiota bacterium]